MRDIKRLLREELMKVSKMDMMDIEDEILDRIPDNQLYHGSKDISWFSQVSDFDTLSNTQNAKSKYIFLTPNKYTALNYSLGSSGMDRIINDNSGILAFKLTGGKGKKLVNKDFKDVTDINSVEAIYDLYKENGYDYLINTVDGQNRIILNPNILKSTGVYRNIQQ